MQIVAAILLLLGAYSLYTAYANQAQPPVYLSGVGALLMALALLVLSRSAAIRGKQDSPDD
jgi:hypothetical protein